MRNLNDAVGVDIGFVRNQSHVLNSRAFEIEYPEMDYASLVPVNTDYPEWASGVDTYVGDKVGAAKWQSGYSKDVPLADVTLQMVSSTFAMYAVGYQWNVEELGKATFANYPLTSRKATAARFAAEVFVWETALIGAGHPGWTGFINNQYITPVSAPATGTSAPQTAWVLNDGTGNKTPEQIVAELNSLVMGPPSTTGVLTSLLADTILLPPLALTYLVNTPYGVTSPNTNILQYFVANNEYIRRTGRPITIRELPVLSTSATVGVAGGGRAIGYRNAQDVLELPMPMPYGFLNVYQDGPLQYTVPGIGRVGQLQIFKSNGVRYLDGITPVPPAA